MAAIEHRRDLRRGLRPSPSLRQLPVVGKAFIALPVVAAAIEMSGVATAWWAGAEEWWSVAPPLLPAAARSVALVVLPAAVAWGGVGGARRNAWLWRGAVLLAIV